MSSDHVCPSCGADWSKGKFNDMLWVTARGACDACDASIVASLRAYFGPGVTNERIDDIAKWCAGEASEDGVGGLYPGIYTEFAVSVATQAAREQRAADERRVAGLVAALEEIERLMIGNLYPNAHTARHMDAIAKKALAAHRAGKGAE